MLQQSDANALMQLYAAGQYTKLEHIARTLLHITPNDALLNTIMGASLLAQDRPQEAIEYFKQTERLQPIAPDTHNNLGSALRAFGDSDGALKCFKRALELKPDHAVSHLNAGIALHSLGLFDQAAESWKTAISLQPKYPEAICNLGLANQMTGNLSDARKYFELALQQNPKHAEAHYNLHTLLIDENNMQPAIESLERAVGLAPAKHGYKTTLGILYEYTGQPEKAAPLFDFIEKNARELYKARIDAWRYIKEQTPRPRIFGSPLVGFQIATDAAPDTGLVLEFGVRFAASTKQIHKLVKQVVHGFDSFEGLPEAWHDRPTGSYSTQGVIPEVPEGITLHQGWFEDTLPRFAEKHKDPIRVMNIDCDIYSSTKTVLDTFAGQIISGSVLVFDEYIGNKHWRDDEHKAFQEAAEKNGWEYEYLGFSFVTKQVVVRIL